MIKLRTRSRKAKPEVGEEGKREMEQEYKMERGLKSRRCRRMYKNEIKVDGRENTGGGEEEEGP
jgi:hypothetical protein